MVEKGIVTKIVMLITKIVIHRKLIDCCFELSDDEEEECCFRCGRDGHYANECYAKKNIDGFYIRD